MYGNNVQLRIGGPITPIVKKLMIVISGIFILQLIIGLFSPGIIEYYFGLHYRGFFQEYMIWQIVTYMFLHGNWFHIIINLIGLWMFAGELEQLWGSRIFLKYYFVSGIGAGIFITLMNYILFHQYHISHVTLGASGAIYGILLAYGLTWPNREILLYFAIPIKIKYFVLIFGLIEFFGSISAFVGRDSNISHIGHLGGIISGLIYMLLRLREYIHGFGVAFKRVKKVPFTNALQKAKLKKKRADIEMRIKAKEIIDILLEKIARNGMSSLTNEEKKQLDWARKHYHPEDKETMH